MPQTIGPYEVLRELGRGGMGVVHLARDTRLDRLVAIKSLPEHLAQDPDRLARFEREARTLAQLNHPNVAGIYGVEQHDGARYLVLEYVEGETLAARLDLGALPVDEALEIAVQIAAGVEAAHEAGVIHRDLKPGNVIVTPGGKAKVLDFGLARADRTSSSVTVADANNPTLTSPAYTDSPTIPGAILGTAAYMSPEQARGRPVDKRTDIWSFGVILYEMLTNANPFRGETVSDSIGAVLHKRFDLDRLPPGTPAAVRRVLERCIERDVSLRYRDIGDVRLELQRREPAPAGARSDRRRSSWAVAVGVVLIAIVGLAAWFAGRSSAPVEPRLVAKFDIYSRETDRNRPWANRRRPVISPDATRVALLLDGAVYVRDLAEFEPRLLPGTEGARHVFWSPDSQWLGFTVPEMGIFKTPVAGGGVTRINGGEPSNWLPPAWVEGDRILFQDGDVTIKEVSPRGGAARVVLERDPEKVEDFHGFLAIPGTDVLILNRHDSSGPMVIEATDGRRSVDLIKFEDTGSTATAWSPTGHILYEMRESPSDTWALPFSAAALAQTGDQFLAIEGMSSPSVAADGTIAGLRGEMPMFSNRTRGEFVFIDGKGAAEHIGYSGEPESGWAIGALLSPDESHIAFARVGEDRTRELWIHEIERGINTRIASPESDGEEDSEPLNPFLVAWSPDGSRLAVRYGTQRFRNPSASTLRIIAADGSGPTDESIEGYPVFISRDWSTALLRRGGPDDPTIVSVDLRDGTTTELPELNAMDDVGSLSLRPSPDGQHILFQQGSELYCARFPDITGRIRVSTHGGKGGFWSRDGSTIYYAEPRGGLSVTWMKVEVTREPTLRFGLPEPVFADSDEWRELSISLAETSAPEKFFAVRNVGGEEAPGPAVFSIIRNWYEPFRAP